MTKTRFSSPKIEKMAVISGITIRQNAFDATIKKTFTKIDVKPTRRMKDNLLTEVKKVLVGVCVTGFEFASKYGLLVEIIGKTEFDNLSGKDYKAPPENDPREKDIADKGERRIYENFMVACFTRSGACEAICQNI